MKNRETPQEVEVEKEPRHIWRRIAQSAKKAAVVTGAIVVGFAIAKTTGRKDSV